MSYEAICFKGHFTVEHLRDGNVIAIYDFDNAITTEGKNHVLNTTFVFGTQIGAWYVGLVDSVGYTALAAGDTYAAINQAGNGWDEFATYTDLNNTSSATTRPLWPSLTVTAGAVTNATTKAIYDITTGGVIKGLFIVGGSNAQVKSNNSGGNTLWSSALFNSGDVTVVSGDQLKVTYSLGA
jgi:hypothetical protein